MKRIGLFALALAATTSAHAAVTISTAETKNMNCSGGVCTPTDKGANLNTGDLQTMLAASDVTVKTAAGAVAIGVASPLTWTSTHRLTLDSVQFIHIKAAVVVEGTAGLTLTTNDGGTGGDLVFEGGGYVNFWDLSSSLVINGASHTLVGDIKTLASNIKANPSGNYALTRNYDASADGIYAASPIQTTFEGAYEGLGNVIAKLSISSKKDFVGLFQDIDAQGRVENLILTDVNIAGTWAGGLAGENSGTIRNTHVSGTVAGDFAGGLVGENIASIFSSFSTANVSGLNAAGGLVGENDGSIDNCHATGAVQGIHPFGYFLGGLAGKNFATISNSSATGAVTTEHETAGGLVGVMYRGDITGSFATGNVSGGHNSNLGGLVGGQEAISAATSYATGNVTGGFSPGGLMASFGGDSLSAVYSTGHVKGHYRAGLIGHNYPTGNVSDAFWDIDTSGTSVGVRSGSADGITGLTDAQLKSALPAGFDPAVWGQSPSINNGWPYLLANPPQ